MKKLSQSLLASTVTGKRKEKKITQQQLADLTGINRGMLSRLEQQDYIPSIEQIEKLGEVLDFEVTDLFVSSEPSSSSLPVERTYRIDPHPSIFPPRSSTAKCLLPYIHLLSFPLKENENNPGQTKALLPVPVLPDVLFLKPSAGKAY